MANPLLSIVTGTYQRLPYLQRMIESARRYWPRHLGLEFIIVDGGSTDGTLAWLNMQPDVRLINHGNLRGAIPAFCEGARAARGDYVLLANDDVEFHAYSIPRALSYLETHRECGAVAFADDRQKRIGNSDHHEVAYMQALKADGTPIGVIYAQVGLFRRWLGEQAGWWGDEDLYMSKARTYGGDNFLSARLWEMGYRVETVAGCLIDDLIPADTLREQNVASGPRDSAQYYGRYPRGPLIQVYPVLPNPQRERLRVILMDIHEPRLPAREAKERGLAEALAEFGLLWHVDYVNEAWDLPAMVRAWQPHLLLTQMHDVGRLNGEVLAAARRECPEMVIVNWNGDAHEKGLISPDVLAALRQVDLQLITNLKVLPVYEREGIPSAYWQIGYKPPAAEYPQPVPVYDVLWQGNCYDERRRILVDRLRRLGVNGSGLHIGVYGGCPESDGNTHYDFAQQAALYRAARITIGDTFPDTEGFVSNRLFQALGAGAFLLQEHSPRLDDLTGLQAGEHYIEWRSLDELEELIREWLLPERASARQKIAEAGQSFVRANFSYEAQVRKLWRLL